MSTMSEQKTEDLEKCVEMYGEGEIHLLEDRRAGKLIYFASWYFFRGKWLWNIIASVALVISAFFLSVSYFAFRDTYYYRSEGFSWSYIFPPLWLTMHYFLAFFMIFVACIKVRQNVLLEKKMLRKLLEEISKADIMGDPVAWRRIAFNVNQCFVKKKYNISIFYGGEQCRRFFVKEVVIPVDSGSYDIITYYNGNIYTDYCKSLSNKNLVQKAAATYNKSVETSDELSHMDEEIECDNGLLEKSLIIFVESFLYLFHIEIALCCALCSATVALVLYRAISPYLMR